MPTFIFGQGQLSFSNQSGDLITSAAASRTNCLLCDGSAYSRTTYAALFAAIGTSYGSGDGSTTFNVPDFRGKTVIGANISGSTNNVGVIAMDQNGVNLATRSRGAQSGEENHTLTTAQIAAHNHGVTDPGHGHGVNDPGHGHPSDSIYSFMAMSAALVERQVASGSAYYVPSHESGTWTVWDHVFNSTTGITVNGTTTGISTQNNGSGNSHNNMQPYGVANVFIHI